MPFNFHQGPGIRLDPLSILGQRLPAIFRDRPAVVTEKHVAQPGFRRGRLLLRLFATNFFDLASRAFGRLNLSLHRTAATETLLGRGLAARHGIEPAQAAGFRVFGFA